MCWGKAKSWLCFAVPSPVSDWGKAAACHLGVLQEQVEWLITQHGITTGIGVPVMHRASPNGRALGSAGRKGQLRAKEREDFGEGNRFVVAT